jgi:hypothetical protein
MHLVVIYHLLIHFSHPPSPHPFQCANMPRNQTSGFCRSNIDLGERGALFLSNYMKLQQLSHSFWQRLYIEDVRRRCTTNVYNTSCELVICASLFSLQRNAWVRRHGVVCDSRLISTASFSYPEPFLRSASEISLLFLRSSSGGGGPGGGGG